MNKIEQEWTSLFGVTCDYDYDKEGFKRPTPGVLRAVLCFLFVLPTATVRYAQWFQMEKIRPKLQLEFKFPAKTKMFFFLKC